MLRLRSEQLIALGAPREAGIPAIEDWLRALLRHGTITLEGRVVELRGGERVVTTLGDLKRALGVAMETVKQSLRGLQAEHWIVPVEGEHTCLVGPPRFQAAMTKQNFTGSSTQAIELSVTPGLNPLSSVDYEQLAQPGTVHFRKRAALIEPVSVEWHATVRLPNGTMRAPSAGERFTLATGTAVRLADGREGALDGDTAVDFRAGRTVALAAEGRLAEGGVTVPKGEPVRLGGHTLARLAGGATGILSVAARTVTASGEEAEWGEEGQWIGRFDDHTPLVLLRRVIYAAMRDVAGADEEWKVAIGVHDALLDGSIPARAGQGSAAKSPARLIARLQKLGEEDSLRRAVAEEYGWRVDAADVRVLPVREAGVYDRGLLRTAGESEETNSEMLCLTGRQRCWVQVGAYYHGQSAVPWEVTREVYFPHVALHIVRDTPVRREVKPVKKAKQG